MNRAFLQSDIYSKFDALQERGAGSSAFWEIVARGVLTLLVLVMVYLALRFIYDRFIRKSDRRGKNGWNGTDMTGLLEIGKDLSRQVRLAEIPANTASYVFWEVGDLNCGCGATILSVESIARRLAKGIFAPVAGYVGASSAMYLCGGIGLAGVLMLALLAAHIVPTLGRLPDPPPGSEPTDGAI